MQGRSVGPLAPWVSPPPMDGRLSDVPRSRLLEPASAAHDVSHSRRIIRVSRRRLRMATEMAARWDRNSTPGLPWDRAELATFGCDLF